MNRRLLRDDSAASAAEFALVLPLLLVLLFAIIDGGRWMWTYNRAEKATQMGTRFAVVADPVAPAIGASYLGVGGLTQGDLIPAAAFGTVRCASGGCTCAAAPCPPLGAADTAAFTAIVNRMRLFMPDIQAANVVVEYSSSGLGYAGNPNGSDLQPLVTVRLGGPGAAPVQFTPVTSLMLATLDMPPFTSSLTAEDLSGSQSN